MVHLYSMTDPATLPADLEPPALRYRFVVGVYVAAIAGALAVVGGVGFELSGGGLLLIGLTAVTVGLVAGGAVAGRIPGLPERIGRSRQRMAACFLPPVAFVALGLVGAAAVPEDASVVLGITLLPAAGLAVVALSVVRLSRTRYVDAITPDEPVVSWIWANPRRQHRWLAIAGICLALGGWSLVAGDPGGALWPLGIAALALVFSRYGPFDIHDDPDAQRSRLRVHDAGLVTELRDGLVSPMFVSPTDGQYGTGIVPWEGVTGVERTDDELVIERARRFDVRCRLSVIDDPEAVRDAIERARRGSGDGTDDGSSDGASGQPVDSSDTGDATTARPDD